MRFKILKVVPLARRVTYGARAVVTTGFRLEFVR
jgi:hypothetical protein